MTAEEHRELRRGAAIVVLADALLRRTPADRVGEIEVASADGVLSICVPAWPRRTADQPTARVRVLFDRDVMITQRPRST